MIASGRSAPASVQELSELLATCDADGRSVCVRGGDTLHGMGLPCEQAGVTIDTASLCSLVQYEPADLTIAVQAGMPLQTLAHILSAHRQFVPLDAPSPRNATVGGTLAAGWLGPRRHLYGRPRDVIIGSTVVLADGAVARAGGMVVKNVAGYDMSRLYVGSFGTLGIFVQTNLKTLPLPPHARVFLAPLVEGSRSRALSQLRALAVAPSAALCIQGFHNAIDGEDGDEGRLVIMLEGTQALLERATRELRSALGRAGVPETHVIDSGARESFQRTIDAYVGTLGQRSITYRLCSFAAESDRIALQLHALSKRFDLLCETIVDALNGDVIARIGDCDARSLGTKIEPFDDALHDEFPAATVIAGEHPHRANLRVWGAAPSGIERMRALKARFDPHATLNPGRFVGGI